MDSNILYADAIVISLLQDVANEKLILALAAATLSFYVLSSLLKMPSIMPLVITIISVGIFCAFCFIPAVTLLLFSGAIVLYALYAVYVFNEWERSFSGHRLTRRNSKCVSNSEIPPVKSSEQNKAKILYNSKLHEQFDSCKLLNSLHDIKKVKEENKIFRERAKRLRTLNPAKAGLDSVRGSLSEKRAEKLNMDHIYIKFTDFLWAYTFIGPLSYLLWKRRTIMLRVRKFLHSLGLIRPKCDYEALAATLLLEQTQAIHYHARTSDGKIAGFFFADFPYVDNNCDFQLADLFAVDIDLKSKRFVKAKLDDISLTAKETVILLWYNTIAAQHVKLHAMANWGVNLDDSLDDVNDFLRQNSVVTAMYNFFGYNTFSRFLKIWVEQGLLSEGWDNPQQPLIKSFNHGIEENVWQHGQIGDLAKYSRFVNFSVKVRAIFLSEFQKFKDIFPGVDGEAMFVGTVLHSLDHTLMDWNLKDPLYLDTKDSRFGKMAEMGQVVKVGFVSDVPGLYFHKRFKGSGHPFYESVYRRAAKIDKELADNMDTCIIK